MLRYRVTGLFFIGLMTVNLHGQRALPEPDTVHSLVKPAAVQNYARLPLAFEKHPGGSGDRFVAQGQGYVIGLDAGKATIRTTSKDKASHTVSLEFAGASMRRPVVGPELPGKVNYILGNDPRKWQLGLPTYARIAYPGVYPGIDVVYYGNQQQLEFDLVVKPGADPGAIHLKIAGAGKLSIDGSGSLNLGEAAGGLSIALPRIYQELNSTKKNIPGRYVIVGKDEVAFRVDRWDRTRALVIDPTIVYSTLFGGGLGSDYGYGVSVDSSGNILFAGYTGAADFPTVAATQNQLNGSLNAFVTKINPAGTALIYSTYLGGSNVDFAQGLAVDSAGAAWVTGYTESSDFPVLNAAQSTYGGYYDAFVARLDTTGVLQFSTFLGGIGNDYGTGIAVDSSNNGYVTGYTQGSFPTTSGVVQTVSQGVDAFAAKYGPTGTLLYSTLLGGAGTDDAFGIAADSAGDAYVTGYSDSSSFAGAPASGAQTSNNGGGDAFVAKLNPTASALLYFTFLGGSGYEEGRAIAVDTLGDAYIGGRTSSTGLATVGAAQTALAGAYNGFAAELNPAGSAFTYYTYLGGSRVDGVNGLALDGSGNVYVTGDTDSVNFPTASPAEPTLPGIGTSLANSANAGASWSAFDSNIPGAVFDISINPAGTSAVVATETGIFRTVSGGASWSQQSGEGSVNGSYLARSPAASGTIYAVFGSDIFKSTDDGVTWTFVGSAPTEAKGLLADPLTANTVYVFGSSAPFVFSSTNGGTTWNSAAIGLPGEIQVVTMAATTDGSLYAGISGYGIFKSTNQGGSWSAVNTGIVNQNVTPNSLTASGTTVYYADNFIYETTNGGASWAAISAPFGTNVIAASPQNASVVYAFPWGNFTSSNTVQESTDGGNTWSAAGSGLPPGITYNNLTRFLVDPSNSAQVFVVAPVNPTAFVAKINNTGSALTWSTYLGGTSATYAYAVATDGVGDAFVTGYTNGGGFPITSTALPAGVRGAFITEISDATAACSTLSVTPGSALASQYAGTLTFAVEAPSGCAWTASTNQPWAAISAGASGTGSGAITIEISYGSSAARTVVLTVGSQNITITQPGLSCSYTLDQSSYPVAAAGGPVSILLTAGAGCPWAVTNNYASAISFTSASSGSGIGTVTMNVAPNANNAARTFILPVGATQIQIVQSGNVPVVTSVTPNTTPAESPATPITVAGVNFGTGSTVSFTPPGGATTAITPSLIQAAQIAATIPATLLTTAGIAQIAIANASGTLSNQVPFTITQTTPSVASVTPNTVPAFSAATPIAIAGAGFNSSSTVSFTPPAGGSPITITPSLIQAAQIAATLPAALLTTAGVAQIAIANGSAALSNQVPFTISPPVATTISLASSGNPSTFGQSVTLTATVSATSGSVTFYDGTTVLGTSTIAGGQATLTTSLLASGTRSLKAYFLGSAGYLPSTSAVLPQTVNTVQGDGFFPPGNYGVGNLPWTIVVADFNGDGIADMAIALRGGGFLVYLGKGDGTFQMPPAFGELFNLAAQSIAAGDFNGDGKTDLIVANANCGYEVGTVGVVLGTSTGAFQGAVDYPATASCLTSIAVGDFNGDGKADAVAVDQNGGLSVFLGNGDGTLQTAVRYDAGGAATFVATGDFNGDGVADLAIATPSGTNVLLGNGDGTFGSPVSQGPGGATVTVADFNGDGKLDLAVTNSGVSILLGNGDGTFQPALNTAAGTNPHGNVAVGDFNGDGKPDIAIAFTSIDMAGVFLGNGDGTFQPPSTYAASVYPGLPAFIAVGDFNRDGRADLAVAYEVANSVEDSGFVSILLGGYQTPPTIASVTPTSVAAGASSAVLTIAGANFAPGSTVVWTAPGGQVTMIGPDVLTAATQIAATIPSSLLTTAGTAEIAVANGVGALSNQLPVNIAPFTITGVTPNVALFGSSAVQITVSGQNLSTAATLSFTPPGGSPVTIALSTIQATQVVATIPATYLTTAGTAQVALANGAGALSNPLTFNITPFTITGITPNAAPVGSGATSVMVTGQNLSTAANLVFIPPGGSPVTISLATIQSAQAAATIPATLLTSAGVAQVALANGAAVLSNQLPFTITPLPASVTLTASPSGLSAFGSVVTLTATLSPSAATGEVTFYDGVTVLETEPVVNGQAVLKEGLLASGAGSLRAYYSGDSTYGANTSGTLQQRVPAAMANGFQPAVTVLANGGRAVEADFNGDGKPDLASVSGGVGGESISISLGNGDGTFQPPLGPAGGGSYYEFGFSPLAAGDFNGDGNTDLAVIGVNNAEAGFVTVLLGNGDGTFRTGTTYAIGLVPQEIVVADFNGDGKADLAVGDEANLNVFLGNGDGSFQTPLQYAFGGHTVESLVVGDFNGDGKADLAVGAGYPNLNILLGNGDGSFTTFATYEVGTGGAPEGIGAADFNGDGIADLAIERLGNTGSVAIMLGNGDGSFRTGPVYAGYFADDGLAIADINGDGKPDIAVADSNGGGYLASTLSVYLGNGDGTFQPPVYYGAGSYYVVAGDFNGDGKTDLVVTDGNGVELWLGALGTTPQTIAFGPLADVATGAAPFSLSATASSGLPVSFASTTPTVCTVSGNTVTVLISGGCSLTATQAGNATYAPAVPITQDFTVLFNDISPSASYAAAVDLLAQYGITAGCGNDDFCANGLVTRADMAIFIITGIFRGADFSYSTTPHFADVQPGAFGFKWIQAMYELGITAGCGGGNYCPNGPVTREEMAVFIIVARLGSASFTYSSTPDFADVPDSGATAPYFKFVQRMKQDGITAGCAKAVAPSTLPTYCPDESVTRAQMAVFMMAGLFNYPLPAGAPAITAISPSTLGAGTSGTFTITGVNTNFVQGTTMISPIPGVTVGTITVNSSTSLTVQLTAAANATPRPYTIVAITNSEQDVLPNSLTIQ